MILRNVRPRVFVGWAIVLTVVAIAGFPIVTKLSQRAPKPVADKILDRLYDARKDGLKTLSFRVRVEWTNPSGLRNMFRNATVYWEAPDRVNVVAEDASGKPEIIHPMYAYYFNMMYLRPYLPVFPSIGPLQNAKAEPTSKGGHIVTATHPFLLDRKLRGSIKAVYECDHNFAVKTATYYGVTGAGAPPKGTPHQVVHYRIVADGRALMVEDIHYGRSRVEGKDVPRENSRDNITYDQVGGFWLPLELKKKSFLYESVKAITFSDYKVNSKLPSGALNPPEWPKATLDLSTPEKTVRSLYDALYLGDLKAIGDCLTQESRAKWEGGLEKVRQQYSGDPRDKTPRPAWDMMWGGFIHGNAGKTTQIDLADRKETDTTFTAHIRTETDGRPVDYQVRLKKEGGQWKVDNSTDEIMKGYD